MQKILICAPEQIASVLEEKLRHNFDIEIELLHNYDVDDHHPIVCEIRAKVKKDWITICRFTHNENLKDILTMFQVNYELKTRKRK